MIDAVDEFHWQDGERTIHFGRGLARRATHLVGDGYALLTTPRAAEAAPALVEAAASRHDVPEGRVDDLAAALRPDVEGEVLVALGGGRVIDTAKALAAADPPRRVAAVPTTLSGAEMTVIHRHAAGVPGDTPRVRPALVVNDPALSASQPEPGLTASALNALGHAVEAPVTTMANPVATLAAVEAAQLLVGALAGPEPDRDRLALGALLAAWSIDSARYGLHHVMSQTLVRHAGVGHGPANAAMLPHTLHALAWRFPGPLGRLDEALGEDAASVAARLAARAGCERLRDLGVAVEALAECADAAARRPELALTPPPADRAELLALYESAW